VCWFSAHLKPGSVAVRVGDRVRQGQRLGLLGNSGNTDFPHLHFQLTNGASPAASDGLP
jgi:murein DD-endopeptidase MepM/ murein hydrolase activator NlpD